jgi:hypothetical protein
LSTLNDFEIAWIKAEINCCYYRIEQLTEILNKDGEAKGYTNTTKTPPPNQTTNQPNQTTSDFDKLPWKSYKTKQDAKPDEAGWIFANTKGAETILETLKANDGKAKFGNFECYLQGENQTFIARKPVKTESSTTT